MTANRLIVSVATGTFVKGQRRLARCVTAQDGEFIRAWVDMAPYGCPNHRDVPYAFKAYALKAAMEEGAQLVMWCDASVIPIRSLAIVWEQIERDGYWISKNGWDNSDWTADSAYADLFPGVELEAARELNRRIPHVIATAFGLDLRQDIGRSMLIEYYRLASETRAFCGPWTNTAAGSEAHVRDPRRAAPCGPASTLGHRHDQTALAVIASRHGCALTEGPHIFAYAKRDAAGEAILDPAAYVDDTVLLAIGV